MSEQRRGAGEGMVGGAHYKKLEIDPWMVIRANHMGYFDGNALKYIMRYRVKGGVEDLKKAQHYLEELIRQEEAALPAAPSPSEPFGYCEGEPTRLHAQERGCIHWRQG